MKKKAKKRPVKKVAKKRTRKAVASTHKDTKSHNTNVTVISGLKTAMHAAVSQYGKLAEKYARETTKRGRAAVRKKMAAVKSQINKINRLK